MITDYLKDHIDSLDFGYALAPPGQVCTDCYRSLVIYEPVQRRYCAEGFSYVIARCARCAALSSPTVERDLK